MRDASRPWKQWAASLAVGILVGALTLGGQSVLPTQLNFLANSGAVWMLPAFAVSLIYRKKFFRSAVGSVLALLGCVLGYYCLEAAVHRHALPLYGWMLLWLAMSPIAGTLCGAAAYGAHAWTGLPRGLCRSLLPAVFLSEGASKCFHIADYAHMRLGIVLSLALGAALYVLFNGRESSRPKHLLALALLTAAGIGFFEILFRISHFPL